MTTTRGGPVLAHGLLWAGLPSLAAVGLGLLVARAVDQPFSLLSRDPSATTGAALYVGALSALTVMVWTAGAAVALASALPRLRRDRVARPLALLGGLTLAFAVDDEFLVHDRMVPGVGLPQELVYAGYVAWMALVVVLDGRLLRSSSAAALLVVAAAALGASVLADEVVDLAPSLVGRHVELQVVVEDGLKLLGAALWGAALVALAHELNRRPAAGAD